MILFPSSDCLMTGRSVKVGLIPSAGRGAASPKRMKDPDAWLTLLRIADEMTLKEINPKCVEGGGGVGKYYSIKKAQHLSDSCDCCLCLALRVKNKRRDFLDLGCLRPGASAAPKAQNHYIYAQLINLLTRLAIYFLKSLSHQNAWLANSMPLKTASFWFTVNWAHKKLGLIACC